MTGDAILDLDARPASARDWLAELWRYRHVLLTLARSDFHVRYKRAAFGVVWAVVIPLFQAAVLAVVFSRVIRASTGSSYAVFVLSGVLPWGYFSPTLGISSTAIVDGSGLTDKVWFPRALLPMVPCLANVVGLVVSLLALLAALPLFGVGIGPEALLLLPAAVLLVVFTTSLGLVLAALHVYFRDVRFLVQAALLVWLYVTPVIYPARLVGSLRPLLDLNPMTGVVTTFRAATVGTDGLWVRPVVVALIATAALLTITVELHRRHDRLFVDQL